MCHTLQTLFSFPWNSCIALIVLDQSDLYTYFVLIICNRTQTILRELWWKLVWGLKQTFHTSRSLSINSLLQWSLEHIIFLLSTSSFVHGVGQEKNVYDSSHNDTKSYACIIWQSTLVTCLWIYPHWTTYRYTPVDFWEHYKRLTETRRVDDRI